jgi:NAD(P)-dependent dehydrogenase (short-subunit alcohol dehydrogenase family)
MQGNIVVVTGASAGIGRATAIAFAKRGCRVALLARGSEGLAGARQDVERAGGSALAIPTDVADFAQVEAAAAQVEREWGGIDVWVNNAMATIFCDFLDIAPADFRRATEVTYLGAVWGTRAALKRMKPRDRGVIVQVGSALAYRSIPLQSTYCGAKSALRGFTDSLRSELIHAHSNVHLTMVHLSAFNTPQFDTARNCTGYRAKPLGKIFQPEVAAEAIYWAAHHNRPEVYVGWPTVKAIIGNKLAPRFADWYLARTGYQSQQTNIPENCARPDNLWKPVRGDHGAHGDFDARAHRHSYQLWFTTNRRILALSAAPALAALLIGKCFLETSSKNP